MAQKSIHDRLMSQRSTTAIEAPTPSGHQVSLSSRPWGRILSLSALAVVLAAVGGFVAYENLMGTEAIAQNAASKPPIRNTVQPRPQRQTAPAPAAAAPAAAETTPDPFATHASDAGVKTCAGTYAALGKALTAGSQFMVQTQTSKSDADRHALQGVVGMSYKSDKGYSGPAGGVVFATPNGQACEGDMVRVVPFAQNCQAAAALLPSGSTPQAPLSGLVVFAFPSGGQAMLMPAGTGCVVISIQRIAQGQ